MTAPLVLYVDDEQGNLDIFQRAFQSDFTIKTTLSAEEALKIVAAEEVALVLADQRMPGMTGIELCEKLYRSHPDTIRAILTAYTDTQILLDAIRRGHVHDYIVKPWKKADLKPVLERFMQDYGQKKNKMKELESRLAKVEILEEDFLRIYDNRGVVGVDTGLQAVMATIKKAAPSNSTILLLGETGTGKELLARTIHAESKRSKGPFVPAHCAAFAKTLIESELFGHEKGAFTGAAQSRSGRFEVANGGTIFLDEVGEIPEEVQVKLLRVIQEREIQRVGGNRLIPIDVRLIAATHKNLEQEVREGRFREDLWYRLKVIEIKVPALRERKQDIIPLANYYLHKYATKIGKKITLSPEALQHLTHYDWPGNVRELENIIERAVILTEGSPIETTDLNLPIEEMLRTEKIDMDKMTVEKVSAKTLRSEGQKKDIQELSKILIQTGGNMAEAARLLGIARSTLFHRLKKYQLI